MNEEESIGAARAECACACVTDHSGELCESLFDCAEVLFHARPILLLVHVSLLHLAEQSLEVGHAADQQLASLDEQRLDGSLVVRPPLRRHRHCPRLVQHCVDVPLQLGQRLAQQGEQDVLPEVGGALRVAAREEHPGNHRLHRDDAVSVELLRHDDQMLNAVLPVLGQGVEDQTLTVEGTEKSGRLVDCGRCGRCVRPGRLFLLRRCGAAQHLEHALVAIQQCDDVRVGLVAALEHARSEQTEADAGRGRGRGRHGQERRVNAKTR